MLGWLRATEGAGPIPPFCVVVALNDGSQHFLKYVFAVDEASQTIVLRV